MILTCPECATRYFLPDLQIGQDGRMVKCAQCGASWREYPQAELDAGEDLDSGDPIPVAPPPKLKTPKAAPAPAPPPSPVEEVEDPLSPAAIRRAEILRDKKAEAERRARQAATVTAAVWAAVVAVVAVGLVLAAVFRGQVVQLMPGAATAYAAVGLPVNSAGLTIEKVLASPKMLGGRRALIVSGVLRNVAAGAVVIPAFRVDILGKDGAALDRRILQVSAPPLKMGQTQSFSLDVINPPAGYQDVAVTFALPPAAGPKP